MKLLLGVGYIAIFSGAFAFAQDKKALSGDKRDPRANVIPELPQ